MFSEIVPTTLDKGITISKKIGIIANETKVNLQSRIIKNIIEPISVNIEPIEVEALSEINE